MSAGYNRAHAIVIRPKAATGTLPRDSIFRPFLINFGTICDLQKFRIGDATGADGPPNIAIAVFNSRSPVDKVLNSSKANTDGSFWQIHSVTAQYLRKDNKQINRLFLTRVVPRLTSKLTGDPSGSSGPPQPNKRESLRPDFEDRRRPAKRLRTQTQNGTFHDITLRNNRTSIHDSPQTSKRTPDSPEWMRARIAQLEAELDSAKAACDMAVSEQEIVRTAHQAEQRARREAMSQKSAAEAALSRKEAGQHRLHSDLEAALAQRSALSDDVDNLRGRLATAEEKLRLAQSSLDQSPHRDERIKTLELELETARDQAHKLQLQKSRLEQCEVNPSAHELEDARGRIKELKSKVKELKTGIAQAHEQLGSAQQSLESMERKYSSSRRRYESTKAKLGTYKVRLENEQNLLMKLRDTLTPAAYQSLGATHETLGAFLSAMGLPSASEEENVGPKEESD